MPTPGERRALIFLAAIAVLGVAVRGFRELRGAGAAPFTGDRAGLARQIEAVDSAVATGGAKRRGRLADAKGGAAAKPRVQRRPAGPRDEPPMAPERPQQARYPRRSIAAEEPAKVERRRLPSSTRAAPIDLDTALLDEIAAIPVIGPALARRIVADRIERGPFGSIEGLMRVRGISRALARRFEPYITFSLPPRSGGAAERAAVAQKGRRP